MFKSVLMVCVGNICRSPMAEALLKAYCMERGLRVSIDSAGIGALVDHPADDAVVALMQQKNIDMSGHRAKQVNAALIADYELILVMEQGHIQALVQMQPQARGRVHLLGKWNEQEEISDPYQKSQAHFVAALSAIERNIILWGAYL